MEGKAELNRSSQRWQDWVDVGRPQPATVPFALIRLVSALLERMRPAP